VKPGTSAWPWIGAALAAALSGCRLLGSSGEGRIEPPGPIYTIAGPVTVRIAAAAGRSRAELILDGKGIGTFPVGQDVTIAFQGKGEGAHALLARVFDGERELESKEVRIVVDRTQPRVNVDPRPGEILRDGPFMAVVDFGEPVDPASVVAELHTDGSPPAPVPATAELQAGGRRLVVTTAARFLDVEPVTLKVDAKDLAGNATWRQPPWVLAPRWWAPTLGVSFHMADFRPPGSGVVHLVIDHLQPAGVRAVEVAVDGIPIGVAAPGQGLAWDTRSFADGLHQLVFRAPGYRAYRHEVEIDNTPPALVSCAPFGSTTDDAALLQGVLLTFSGEVCGQRGLSDLDWNYCYDPGPPAGYDGTWSTTKRVVPPQPFPPLPFTWRVDLPSFQDRAGNRVAAEPSCTVEFPAWRRPWGAGPLLLQDGGAMGEAAIAFKGFQSGGPDMGYLVRIAPAGSARPGAVERLASDAPGTWAADGPALNANPLAVASQLVRLGWIETDAAGGTTIMAARGLGTAPAVVATRDAARGPVVLSRSGSNSWIETGPGGARQIQAANGSIRLLPPLGPEDPAAVIADAVSGSGFVAVRVAHVEAVPGGVAQLRLRDYSADTGAWASVGGVLNGDPARSASEPTLGALDGIPALAWAEAGQVLARVDLGSGFGPAQNLNADPAAPARSPTASFRHVVFLERGAGGDRFEVREWDLVGRAWRALPPLDAGGDVAAYTVYDPPLAILWRDAAGGYRLRVYNEIR